MQVEELEIEFVKGRMWVSDVNENDLSVASNIEAVLMSIYWFKHWAESRWLTVGSRSRQVLNALLTGMGDLVGRDS